MLMKCGMGAVAGLHVAPKTLIRLEDLLADTSGSVRCVYSELGMEAGRGDALARAVERHS